MTTSQNPELSQRLMQLSKDLQNSLQSALGKLHNDVDATIFVQLTTLANCCIELASCCTALVAVVNSHCGSAVPPPVTTTSTAPVTLTTSTAFTAAMPTLGNFIQQLPGMVDNAITGALKQLQNSIAQLQFPDSPEETSDPPQEEDMYLGEEIDYEQLET